MASETVMHAESLNTRCDANEQADYCDTVVQSMVVEPRDYKEINLLQFVNDTTTWKIESLTTKTVVGILVKRDLKFSFCQGQNEDEEREKLVFMNDAGNQVVRTIGDVRQLYEERPESMENMCLAQFANQYYKLKNSQPRIMKTAEESINDTTGISKHLVD